jgi:predicted alpha/beta superfamily hydrolase
MNSRLLHYVCGASMLALMLCCLPACKKGVKQQEDELYSRHLQRKVMLTVISTPMPDNNADINLLVCNDGQLFDQLNVKSIADSLYRKNLLLPLVIVGVHAGNRLEEYGVAERSGKAVAGGKADHYDSFFNNELYPYAKKNAGVRKFRSVAVAGFGAGGLSALDIAWNHPDKIGSVAVFSGAFSRKEKDSPASDSLARGMMYERLKSSRKRPRLQYWFYAGAGGVTGIAKDDAEHIAAATASVVQLLENKNFTTEADIVYRKGAANDSKAWRQAFPGFLEWAFGR